MQVAGAFVMLLFSVFVVISPNRNLISLKAQNQIYNKSRWLLVSGLALFSVQFMLQRLMGFRNLGVSQAVAVNNIFLVPAMVLINLSILNLFYFGKLKTWHTRLSMGVIGTIYALLATGAVMGDGGLMGGSAIVRVTEILSSVLTGVCLIIYNVDTWKRYRRISAVLDDYYDMPQQSIIRRFAVSVSLFAALTIITPITTYTTHTLVLQVHGFLAFSVIGFMVMGFLRFGAENSMMLLMPVEKEAQEDAVEVSPVNTAIDILPESINEKVKLWLDENRHLRAGITAAEITNELGITRDELKLYIHSQDFQKIGSWLAYHRIEHAKKLMKEYNNYNHDTIAVMCGFASREYFQKCFKDVVGVPPMMWLSLQNTNPEA